MPTPQEQINGLQARVATLEKIVVELKLEVTDCCNKIRNCREGRANTPVFTKESDNISETDTPVSRAADAGTITSKE